MIVYEKPARLHRTRWLFDQVDEFVQRSSGDHIALLIVLPSADPPDGPTRAENKARLRKLGRSLRRIVTVPIGDAFRMTVVRTIMRAIALLQGQARVHFVEDSMEHGVGRLLEAASSATPPAHVIEEDLQAMYEALGARISLSA